MNFHHDPVRSRCCSSQGHGLHQPGQAGAVLGSTSTGRWLSSFSMGTAAKSKVLRVLVS